MSEMKCGQSMTPLTDALMDKHFTNQPSAKLTVAYGVLHAHACQLESSLAEAVAALREIADRAKQNALIQRSVGHKDSAAAWNHCANKAETAVAKYSG